MILAAVSGWILAGILAVAALAGRRAGDARMEAVARASHELRGPLTAARLGLTLGARGGALSPGRLRAIDTELGRAALALDDLTRVRFDVGGRGALGVCVRPGVLGLRSLERVAVADLVSDSAEAWRPAAAARDRALELRWQAGAAAVWGDRLRLAQALGNLLANAVEHGAGAIDVSGAVRAGRLRIEVADGGPGLPAPIPELVRRARGGRGDHGRGLAIAAQVAAGHGGRLTAAPASHGARLVLELPLAGAAAGASDLG